MYGWEKGETGTWDMVFEEGCETDCNWLQYQSGGATYISSSGTLTIDQWTEVQPENSFDARIGLIDGTFASTLSCWMGCEADAPDIAITDGVFSAMVTESADAKK